MICLGGSNQKNNYARQFLDTGILACQEPDKIQEIRKFDTVFTGFQWDV